ncbi:LarC family nickel insertion protein [Heliorestis acidaminivorans]|uniref:LarC family nickel insertion protein n=1 Tax=Heliorestis acidaminivorans TaxID=553427 RepID=A0A6I0ETF5_9FIRM|nr:nickel insertion protein [Heliorestis acidaminivorans]KAB2953915.1 LarC family nickel insertion protein [Heliorestis acidaminivorans]
MTESTSDDTTWEEIYVIEATIDDMNPQWFRFLRKKLFSAGALDVQLTSTMMKKERVGQSLKILVPLEQRDKLVSLIFQHSTTIGLRCRREKRIVLKRDFFIVDTPYGPIAMKRAFWQGEVINVQPEYDDCVKAAHSCDVSIKEVYQRALSAYYSQHVDY